MRHGWLKNISLDSSDITDVRFNRLYNISTEYLKLGELSLALSVANEISKEGWQKSSALEAIVWWYMQRNYLDEALRVARTLGEGYSKCSLIKEIERRFSLQSPLDRNKCIIS